MSVHHPFTAPYGLTQTNTPDSKSTSEARHPSDADRLRAWLAARASRVDKDGEELFLLSELLTLRAQHYDLVCNGIELGGGSIRIHDSALQADVLRSALTVSPSLMEGFAALLAALSFGAPPHGGFALGFDRLMALLAGHVAAPSIRDVIAFPKSSQGNEPMTGAPAGVDLAAMAEFHIRPS